MSLQILILALTAIAIASLGIALLLLHKTRKIHIATFQLLADSDTTRRETRVLFSQLQALHALERRLQLPRALPAMRGWAGSPDFLLALADELLERQPTTVLECSSGVSTVVAARCMQLNGRGHVYSLEHEAEYATKTRQLLAQYGLSEWATVVNAPLTNGAGAPWYSLDSLPNDLPPVDVLVVDGPPAAIAPLARHPALPRLMPRLAPSFCVFLDDADRQAEKTTVEQWKREFPSLQLTRIPSEKGLAVLRRAH
jgi:predicted O-methyltransferase YrrM